MNWRCVCRTPDWPKGTTFVDQQCSYCEPINHKEKTMREPLALEIEGVEPDQLEDALAFYVGALGAEPKIIERMKSCPECRGVIIACDNGWLDPKNHAEQGGDEHHYMWALMELGPLVMMGSGGGSKPSLRMHRHQPDPAQDLE